MSDGLKNAIAEAFIADTTQSWAAALIAAEAVRAWLALPPSEDEIAAVAHQLRVEEGYPATDAVGDVGRRGSAERIIAASRTVLIERGNS